MAHPRLHLDDVGAGDREAAEGVAKVVKAERAPPRGRESGRVSAPHAVIGQPRAVCLAEDEVVIRGERLTRAELRQPTCDLVDERDRADLAGLRGCELAGREASAHSNDRPCEVHIAPAHRAQLPHPHPGERRCHVERRVLVVGRGPRERMDLLRREDLDVAAVALRVAFDLCDRIQRQSPNLPRPLEDAVQDDEDLIARPRGEQVAPPDPAGKFGLKGLDRHG